MAAVEQLPPEIILDIISRLPAESVIHCKCVCRSWRSLLHLNNRHFATLHLHQQQQQLQAADKYCRSQFNFIKYDQYGIGIRGQDFQILEYDCRVEDYQSQSISYRIRKLDHHVPILVDNKDDPFLAHGHLLDVPTAKAVGSCNGLVCLAYVWDPTYICNPVTREYITLPRHAEYFSHTCTTDLSHFMGMVSGFGYHPGTNEYKVVRIYYESSDASVAEVDVYTVGKDCGKWRNKGSVLSNVKLADRATGVSYNGTLYWQPSEVSKPLLGFDLADEEFYPVQVPQDECCTNYYGPSAIGILGGCLSLTTQPPSNRAVIDVWVMTDCTRNKELWVKKFSMPAWFGSSCGIPCALTNTGETLMWYDCDHKSNSNEIFLGCYDPKTGKLKRPLGGEEKGERRNPTSMHLWGSWRGFPHIKSFISLKDLGEEDAKPIGRKERVKVTMSMKRKAATTSSSTRKLRHCFENKN